MPTPHPYRCSLCVCGGGGGGRREGGGGGEETEEKRKKGFIVKSKCQTLRENIRLIQEQKPRKTQ